MIAKLFMGVVLLGLITAGAAGGFMWYTGECPLQALGCCSSSASAAPVESTSDASSCCETSSPCCLEAGEPAREQIPAPREVLAQPQ